MAVCSACSDALLKFICKAGHTLNGVGNTVIWRRSFGVGHMAIEGANEVRHVSYLECPTPNRHYPQHGFV